MTLVLSLPGGADESPSTPRRDLLPSESGSHLDDALVDASDAHASHVPPPWSVTRHVPWLRVSGFGDELRAVREHYIEQEDIK